MNKKEKGFLFNYAIWAIFGYLLILHYWLIIFNPDFLQFINQNFGGRQFKLIFFGYLIVLAVALAIYQKLQEKTSKVWPWILFLLFGLAFPDLARILMLFDTPWLHFEFVAKYARYFQIFFFSLTSSWLVMILTEDIKLKININWQKYLPWFLFGSGVLLYGLYTYFKHASFGTPAKDVGLFDQAIWSLSQFHSPESTIRGVSHLWADHFHPILLFLAPLYWIWDNVLVLLFAQVMIVASGVFPIYWLAKKYLKTDWAGFCFGFAFLFYAGLQHALAFGFYPENLAIAFFAWAIYFFYQNKKWQYLIFLFLFLFSKENLSLYVAFLGIYFIFKRQYFWGLFNIFLGVVWYGFSIGIVIPYFAQNGYEYFAYPQLGSGVFASIKTIISNPLYTLQVFTTPDIKMQTILYTFASSGFLVFDPFVIAALPNLGERFLSNREILWQIGYHYSGSITSIMIILAVFSAKRVIGFKPLEQIGQKSLTTIMASLVLVSTIMVSYYTESPLVQFKTGKPWRAGEDQILKKALAKIPENASVSTQDTIAPHLSHRAKIYLYPETNQAEFIIIDPQYSTYPISPKDFPSEIKRLLENENYGVYYSQGQVVIFEKNLKKSQTISKELQAYIE